MMYRVAFCCLSLFALNTGAVGMRLSGREMQRPSTESVESKMNPDLYPERKGRYGIMRRIALDSRPAHVDSDVRSCERAVHDYAVKLLLSALKTHGCDFNIRRHISCEKCHHGILGGFDSINNQIVVCRNNLYAEDVGQILGHELVHMFDYCRANVDFENLEHLACTEIRAANLMHCQNKSGALSDYGPRTSHEDCVKSKAVASVLRHMKPGLDEVTASELIDKVFDRCYADLEPFGHRFELNTPQTQFMYAQRRNYGYY